MEDPDSANKEEQKMEIEALRSIFVNEFKVVEAGDDENLPSEFSITVFPYIASAQENHLGVDLIVRFGNKYPRTLPEKLDLRAAKGNLRDEIISDLKETLVRKARTLCGEAMIFALIDKMKAQLELYNDDSILGMETFAKLSDELMMEIFSYLSPRELGLLCTVNSTWNALASSDYLWKRLLLLDFPDVINELRQKYKRKKVRWKKLYAEAASLNHTLQGEQYPMVIVVMRPKGLGRGEIENPSCDIDWREYFAEHLKKTTNFSLEEGKIYEFFPRHAARACCGSYRFLDLKFAEKWYGRKEWMKAAKTLSAKCPWVGQPLGCFCWYPQRKFSGILDELDQRSNFMFRLLNVPTPRLNTMFLWNIMRVSLGPVARADFKDTWAPSLCESRVSVISLMDRTTYGHQSNLEYRMQYLEQLLVPPESLTYRVGRVDDDDSGSALNCPYLASLRKAMNERLARCLPPPKSTKAKTRQFVDSTLCLTTEVFFAYKAEDLTVWAMNLTPLSEPLLAMCWS